MTTNAYLNNYYATNEQTLIENLIIESIQFYGLDFFYIPRTLQAVDSILNEDDLSTFDNAIKVEMYIRSYENFEGEGDFLSKFGLQIRDSMTLTIAVRVFNDTVGTVTSQVRPKEGDLIYFPLNEKIFEIKFVEHESIFYQLGELQVYDLNVELFEYSGERFNTGNTVIDTTFDQYDLTSNAAFANVESVDAFADNLNIEREADKILDFSESNPFSEDPDY